MTKSKAKVKPAAKEKFRNFSVGGTIIEMTNGFVTVDSTGVQAIHNTKTSAFTRLEECLARDLKTFKEELRKPRELVEEPVSKGP